MLSKNDIKRITALHHAKFRDEQQRFLIEGPKIIDELLRSSYTIVGIYAVAEWITSEAAATAKKKQLEIIEIPPSTLERISQLKSPNLVVAEVEIPVVKKQIDLKRPILALDGINDPGNFGTIIRTADWFGIQQIVCSDNCVELYNSKVLQSTMGSFIRTDVFYTDLQQWLNSLADDNPVFGAVMDGDNFYETEFSKTPVFLIGNESKGISKNLKSLITKKITIPRWGGAESLNASIATSVILSEFTRSQR
ncbi:MAG: TrmH family RNA methyltransferase [Bacteroidales bacterium]|nr:TrmH family RNA methyltransferase [Bacteroidales bacterium]